jgi:hypothetical protein
VRQDRLAHDALHDVVRAERQHHAAECEGLVCQAEQGGEKAFFPLLSDKTRSPGGKTFFFFFSR